MGVWQLGECGDVAAGGCGECGDVAAREMWGCGSWGDVRDVSEIVKISTGAPRVATLFHTWLGIYTFTCRCSPIVVHVHSQSIGASAGSGLVVQGEPLASPHQARGWR